MDQRIVIETPAFIETEKKMIPLSLFDEIEVGLRQKPIIALRSEGGFKVETNRGNPIYRLVLAFQREIGGKSGAVIGVRKNIPPHVGLWSGASAAAGVLLTLNRLWKANWEPEKLAKWASVVDPKASKVLKILSEKTAGAKAKGKIILVLPKNIRLDRTWLMKKAKRMKKTFWKFASAHFPDLEGMRSTLIKAGAEEAGMSGNGPVIYGVYPPEMKPKLQSIRKKAIWIWEGKACNGKMELLE